MTNPAYEFYLKDPAGMQKSWEKVAHRARAEVAHTYVLAPLMRMLRRTLRAAFHVTPVRPGVPGP